MKRLERMNGMARRQRGFSLIEVLVALLVALFLLGGLGTMVAGTHKTSTNQTSLATLQDEQRLSMSILNDTVQTAGYFNTSCATCTLTPPFTAVTTTGAVASAPATALAAGQIIGGVHTSITAPDTLVVQYQTSGTDGVINCGGNTSTTQTIFTNFFFVNTSVTPYQLECSSDGNSDDAHPLVNNVVNMQVWYGVSTVTGSQNVDTYMTANQVSTVQWPNVVSVKIILTFNNPLWGQPGQAQYVFLTRVIALQANTGAAWNL